MANALTQKGQVTIPKIWRDKLGLKAGDKVTFAANDSGELTLKATPRTREEFELSLKEAQANLTPEFLEDLARFDNDAVAYVRWLRGE